MIYEILYTLIIAYLLIHGTQVLHYFLHQLFVLLQLERELGYSIEPKLLAIWCMFAQTFPNFQDTGMFVVKSTYNATIYTILSVIALGSNIAVFIYMIYKMKKTKRNPYKEELYTDLDKFKEIKMMM